METIFKKFVNKEIKLNDCHGKIITIEGIDGAGKTTLVDKCVKELQLRGYKAKHFYVSSNFNVFWDVVKTGINNNYIDNDMNQMLHNIYFLTYLKTLFIEYLNTYDFLLSEWYIYGKMVLSELYTKNEFCNSKKLLDLELSQNNIILPDYSFFIDTLPEEALKRIKNRNGIAESKESYNKLIEAYNIWQKYIKLYNIEVLNGMDSINVNTSKILKKVLK